MTTPPSRTSIPQTPEKIQYLQRKRENQRKYRAAHPGKESERKQQNTAYQDREQRRNAKRHSNEWSLSAAVSEPVIIDGEADEAGHYYLFQAYSPLIGLRTLRATLYPRLGLFEVARFLWRLQREIKKVHHKRTTYLYFSMGYDISQQLYGAEQNNTLTHEEAVALWAMRSRKWGAVRGPDFRQEVFIESQHASVYNGRKQGYVLYHGEQLRIVGRIAWQDMFSLSGKSLVSTISDWAKYWTVEEHAEYDAALEAVKAGKAARGKWAEQGYTAEQIETEYQLPELRLMYWYAHKIITLCSQLGLAPRTLAGPAPMARALMTQYGVVSHIKPQDYDTVAWQEGELMQRWIRPAMFGGNIQLAETGIMDGYHKYDIASAYPHWIRKLPCMAHGLWCHLNAAAIENANKGWQILPYAVYDIVWRAPASMRFPPFPVRDKRRGICYPLRGHGRYCSPEIQAFMDCYKDTIDYNITDGWEWVPLCEQGYPFADMIETTFVTRGEYKRAGRPEGNILKLALNSIYGVLAQTSGSFRLHDEEGNTTGYHTPKFSNLFAAAYITSGCRSDIMRLCARGGESVFGVMTDAVMTHGQIDVPTGTALGTLEHEEVYEAVACIAPGVIASSMPIHDKYRGVPGNATWWIGDVQFGTMYTAYVASQQTVPIIEAEYEAYQNPYAAGTDMAQAGKFVPTRRALDTTVHAIASKRDVLRTVGNYSPPYAQATVAISQPYVRPMDAGGELVPERPEQMDR